MARFKRKPNPKNQRRSRPTLASASPVDFAPILPFLYERVGEDHPICAAARSGDLSAFMAAIRESGDTKLDHEIAGELERIANPLQRV
ncbi:MAG TPA: hypothetical protein VLL72_04465 [Kiloniellales bacterium]|nr:hypothetical protein [Kiloniellales bacterium]